MLEACRFTSSRHNITVLRPQSSVTDGRDLGQGQPIGGHQLTYQTKVQFSGWELGQGHTSRYTSADIPGHSKGQWLLMTHRFRGIFRRLDQRNFPSSAWSTSIGYVSMSSSLLMTWGWGGKRYGVSSCKPINRHLTGVGNTLNRLGDKRHDDCCRYRSLSWSLTTFQRKRRADPSMMQRLFKNVTCINRIEYIIVKM